MVVHVSAMCSVEFWPSPPQPFRLVPFGDVSRTSAFIMAVQLNMVEAAVGDGPGEARPGPAEAGGNRARSSHLGCPCPAPRRPRQTGHGRAEASDSRDHVPPGPANRGQMIRVNSRVWKQRWRKKLKQQVARWWLTPDVHWTTGGAASRADSVSRHTGLFGGGGERFFGFGVRGEIVFSS